MDKIEITLISTIEDDIIYKEYSNRLSSYHYWFYPDCIKKEIDAFSYSLRDRYYSYGTDHRYLIRFAGTIIGIFKLKVMGKVLSLHTFYLEDNYRNRGIGKKVISFIEQFGIDHNLDKIIIQVLSKNSNAIRFYERLGYEHFYDVFDIDCTKVSTYIGEHTLGSLSDIMIETDDIEFHFVRDNEKSTYVDLVSTSRFCVLDDYIREVSSILYSFYGVTDLLISGKDFEISRKIGVPYTIISKGYKKKI